MHEIILILFQELTLREQTGWVDPPTLKMHSAGGRAAAILPKPQSDRPHLVLITFPTPTVVQAASTTWLTSGHFNVLAVLGWDEPRGHL